MFFLMCDVWRVTVNVEEQLYSLIEERVFLKQSAAVSQDTDEG